MGCDRTAENQRTFFSFFLFSKHGKVLCLQYSSTWTARGACLRRCVCRQALPIGSSVGQMVARGQFSQ